MNYIIVILILVLIIFLIRKMWLKNKWITPKEEFPSKWRIILMEKVAFYNSLSKKEKTVFEFKIQEFLANCRITGIETDVKTIDKILVASSAIIPILEFPNWRYTNLYEVLIYPNSFNESFETSDANNRNILGMVGTGYMEGKMILSKSALHLGFANESDKTNTAIHEFIHLIDKSDGNTDGIPLNLLEKQYTLPWLKLINSEIDSIFEGKSDINPYGGTNETEFFAVAGEYFFENPKQLSIKHPELYKYMEKIFGKKMILRKIKNNKLKIGRNTPCPCGSGEKFKNCCGKMHYS